MEDRQGLSASEYLDRAFDVIRDEARANPAFASRLVKALGGEVMFPRAQKKHILNPLSVAAVETEAAMRALFSDLSATELKALLRQYNLASAVDIRGLDGKALLDLLVRRARDKSGERMVQPRAGGPG